MRISKPQAIELGVFHHAAEIQYIRISVIGDHLTCTDSPLHSSELSDSGESLDDTIRSKDEDSEELSIGSPTYLRESTTSQILQRLTKEIKQLIETHLPPRRDYCFLSIYDTKTSIDSWDADSIFRALLKSNPDRNKNVVLFLISNGGSVESAYKTTKMCKQFAASTHEVIISRRAKSAVTLIAIGADVFHMGPLGERGPIDPQ